MRGKSLDDLGELQRAVLEVVWETGEGSVHDVRELLTRQKRPAYTTVLSVLQKLEKGGWLTHRSHGRSYVYLPTRSRDEAGASSVRKFIRHVFGGDAMEMMQHLVKDGTIDDAELKRLREMIDDKRNERSD